MHVYVGEYIKQRESTMSPWGLVGQLSALSREHGRLQFVPSFKPVVSFNQCFPTLVLKYPCLACFRTISALPAAADLDQVC